MQQVYHTRTTFINKKLRKLEFFFWKTNNYIKSWIFYNTFGGLKSKTWELQAYTHAAKKDFLSPFSLSVVKLKKTLVTSKIVHCVKLISSHLWPSITRGWTHRSGGKSRDVKKCRAPWKSAHQELRNEPPHDITERLPQNLFLASLWIGQKGILG